MRHTQIFLISESNKETQDLIFLAMYSYDTMQGAGGIYIFSCSYLLCSYLLRMEMFGHEKMFGCKIFGGLLKLIAMCFNCSNSKQLVIVL